MFFNALLLALVPAALAANFPVTIGANNTLTFSPDTVVAAIGDTITFTVVSRNHSTTTTTFSGSVCPPPPGGVGPNGWDSGFLSDIDGSLPTFTYKVVDTAPHFAACMQAAGAHCRAGMTFALNPTAAQTYTQFLANAKAS
ncbi:hypothetical protein FB45DRAFT_999587 [Roridomyces roridus]|uniref:DUF11 domain-containing protein n=1 Tax=Roridomyces roridus TaxID=1738132 RepID=A0AAD7CBU5_9AGAR|nr:hypothetical protein FB45DRAFT_999587 [Roridomyces roridus]